MIRAITAKRKQAPPKAKRSPPGSAASAGAPGIVSLQRPGNSSPRRCAATCAEGVGMANSGMKPTYPIRG